MTQAVFEQCVMFEPRQRPAMADVVRRLESIIKDAATAARRRISRPRGGPQVLSKRAKAVVESWCSGSSRVATALESLISRIEDVDLRTKLAELREQVKANLGPRATDPNSGVYNSARLLRFLLQSEMDAHDANVQVVLNYNAREEFAMDAMRERIVKEDLSSFTVPRMAEYLKYQPFNQNIGFGKDGRRIWHFHFGNKCDMTGLKEAFSIEEYVEGRNYHNY